LTNRVRNRRVASGRAHREDLNNGKLAAGTATRYRWTRLIGETAMMRFLLLLPSVLLLGCGSRVKEFTMPDQVNAFTVLYQNNCAGCHGTDGRLGAARPLNDSVFVATIGRNRLREVIANGVPRTSMPAFSKKNGGELTERQ